jgi:hypothetical protein
MVYSTCQPLQWTPAGVRRRKGEGVAVHLFSCRWRRGNPRARLDLRSRTVGRFHEGVVEQGLRNSTLRPIPGKHVVARAVGLEPGRKHPEAEGAGVPEYDTSNARMMSRNARRRGILLRVRDC